MGDCSPDTGRKSNVHKTFRKRPGCPLNTFKFIKFKSYFQGGCAEETISETQSELNIHFSVCIISRPALHSLAQSFSGNCRDSRESVCFTVKYLILKDTYIGWYPESLHGGFVKHRASIFLAYGSCIMGYLW